MIPNFTYLIVCYSFVTIRDRDAEKLITMSTSSSYSWTSLRSVNYYAEEFLIVNTKRLSVEILLDVTVCL